MKATVRFIRYYEYEVEGSSIEECLDKAEEEFTSDCLSPIADTGYDEYELEVTDWDDEEEENEEDDEE